MSLSWDTARPATVFIKTDTPCDRLVLDVKIIMLTPEHEADREKTTTTYCISASNRMTYRLYDLKNIRFKKKKKEKKKIHSLEASSSLPDKAEFQPVFQINWVLGIISSPTKRREKLKLECV